jgi:hypothetical protein
MKTMNLDPVSTSVPAPVSPRPQKRTGFTVTHATTGRAYRWHFWRDHRAPAAWMLETHDGTQRTLEPTWTDSAPVILRIADNYGMTPPAIS